MGTVTRAASTTFNEDVAEALRRRGLRVRKNAAKFGKSRIADAHGNTLGDIDVLAVDVSARRIFAVECKDFEMARVPHEVRADLDTLFISTERKPCAQEKQLRRVAWVKENVGVVLSSMGIEPSPGEWRVHGAFAFSAALISPMLGKAVLPIWTLAELRRAPIDDLPQPDSSHSV